MPGLVPDIQQETLNHPGRPLDCRDKPGNDMPESPYEKRRPEGRRF